MSSCANAQVWYAEKPLYAFLQYGIAPVITLKGEGMPWQLPDNEGQVHDDSIAQLLRQVPFDLWHARTLGEALRGSTPAA